MGLGPSIMNASTMPDSEMKCATGGVVFLDPDTKLTNEETTFVSVV